MYRVIIDRVPNISRHGLTRVRSNRGKASAIAAISRLGRWTVQLPLTLNSTIAACCRRTLSMPQSVAMSPQTTAVPSAPSRNNPISLRIYKALGTTFDDAATREALDIAAGFYTAPSKDQQGLGEGAIGKGGVNGDDSADRITFQRTLKGSPAAIARRCLKRDVERELAESSRRFLEAFGNVDQVGDTCQSCTRFMPNWI